AWSIQALPLDTTGKYVRLLGITCLSDANCTLVGSASDSTNAHEHALVFHWNGAHWSARPPAAPPGGRYSALWSVACASGSNCFAVGQSYTSLGSDNRRLVEHWNGSSWAIVVTPVPAGVSIAAFTGTACRVGGTCVVVGWYIG